MEFCNSSSARTAGRDLFMALITNRRRSQRLFLQVPVTVSGTAPNKKNFSEKAITVIVNAHGALIEMESSLEQGQAVTLRNIRTSEQVTAVVKLVTAAEQGKFHVAMEFTAPSPAFWHVTFPPEDWEASRPELTKKS
jgi:hypothetical protein